MKNNAYANFDIYIRFFSDILNSKSHICSIWICWNSIYLMKLLHIKTNFNFFFIKFDLKERYIELVLFNFSLCLVCTFTKCVIFNCCPDCMESIWATLYKSFTSVWVFIFSYFICEI